MSGFRVRPEYDTESDTDTDAYGADSDDDLDLEDEAAAPAAPAAPAASPAPLAEVRRPIMVCADGYAILLVECRFVSSVFRAVLTLYDELQKRRTTQCYQQRRYYDKELWPCAVVNHLCLVVRCLEDPSGLEEGLLQAPMRVTLLHETNEPVTDPDKLLFREDEVHKFRQHPVVWSTELNEKFKPSSDPAPDVAFKPHIYDFFQDDLARDPNPAKYTRPRVASPYDDCKHPVVMYCKKDRCLYDIQRGAKHRIVRAEVPETLFRQLRRPAAA